MTGRIQATTAPRRRLYARCFCQASKSGILSGIGLALLASVTLLAYLITMDRGVDFHDYGDFQTVPYILGIPYPTGYPAFVLFGWLWSHSVVVADVAFGLNLLSVIATVISVLIMAHLSRAIGLGWSASIMAALLYAGGFSVWSHSGAASPHVFGQMWILAALLFAVRSWSGSAAIRSGHYSVIASGVALAADNTTLLCLAGIAVTLHGRFWPLSRVKELRVGLCAAICIVLAAYAYLPLRSLYVTAHMLDPTRQLGLAPGAPFWDDRHPGSFSGFIRVISGSDYHTDGAFASLASPASVAHWSIRSLDALGTDVTRVLTYLLPLGFVVVLRRSRHIAIGLFLFAAVPLAFIFSYPAELDPDRYVPRALAVAVLLLAALLDLALRYCKGTPRGVAIPVTLGLLLLYAGALVHDVRLMQRNIAERRQRDARGFARFIGRLTPENAIVISDWNECTPLAYQAYVQRQGTPRFVLCGTLKSFAPDVKTWAKDHAVFYVGATISVPPSPNFERLGQFDALSLWKYRLLRR